MELVTRGQNNFKTNHGITMPLISGRTGAGYGMFPRRPAGHVTGTRPLGASFEERADVRVAFGFKAHLEALRLLPLLLGVWLQFWLDRHGAQSDLANNFLCIGITI